MSLLIPVVVAAFAAFYFFVWRSSKRSGRGEKP